MGDITIKAERVVKAMEDDGRLTSSECSKIGLSPEGCAKLQEVLDDGRVGGYEEVDLGLHGFSKRFAGELAIGVNALRNRSKQIGEDTKKTHMPYSRKELVDFTNFQPIEFGNKILSYVKGQKVQPEQAHSVIFIERMRIPPREILYRLVAETLRRIDPFALLMTCIMNPDIKDAVHQWADGLRSRMGK